MTIEPTNLSAQLHHRAAGNPPSTLPESAVSNCFPGLEFDFRNIWRRLFEGIELHEARGVVVAADTAHSALRGQFLLQVAEFSTLMTVTSPGEEDSATFMEWSNALADVVANHSGELVQCTFANPNNIEDTQLVQLRVRSLFAHSDAIQSATALIDELILAPGELTQSLCSPWQNDYRECACYYWASSRPDYVNIESTAAGTIGNNWLARTPEPKRYDVPELTYEQLFRNWEGLLRFIVGGKYAD